MIIIVDSDKYLYFWKSKGFSDESIISVTASNYSIIPELSYFSNKIRVKFNGKCLKQDKITCQQTSVGLQDVFKMLQYMSARSTEYVFSVTIFRLPRRLQDVFSVTIFRLQDVL